MKKSVDLISACKEELTEVACEMAACGETSYLLYRFDKRQKELQDTIRGELIKINKMSKLMLNQHDFDVRGK
jgi:hypothetical protein